MSKAKAGKKTAGKKTARSKAAPKTVKKLDPKTNKKDNKLAGDNERGQAKSKASKLPAKSSKLIRSEKAANRGRKPPRKDGKDCVRYFLIDFYAITADLDPIIEDPLEKASLHDQLMQDSYLNTPEEEVQDENPRPQGPRESEVPSHGFGGRNSNFDSTTSKYFTITNFCSVESMINSHKKSTKNASNDDKYSESDVIGRLLEE